MTQDEYEKRLAQELNEYLASAIHRYGGKCDCGHDVDTHGYCDNCGSEDLVGEDEQAVAQVIMIRMKNKTRGAT